jgi:CheY-like chemotaxis protein
MTLRELLNLIGLEVVGVAASVNDALCLAQKNTQPDLAIFDVRLSGRRDGIERAALLREVQHRVGRCTCACAIASFAYCRNSGVFLTAQGDTEMRARSGEHRYLRKPVSSQQIVSAVESALRCELTSGEGNGAAQNENELEGQLG